MSEYPHHPPILRTGAKLLTAGKILVTIRGSEHVIPAEEARDLMESLELALAGPGPQIVCEVVEKVVL